MASLPLLLLLVLACLACASKPTTTSGLFCKCTCRGNSTIILLPADKSCSDCTRQYCLDHSLQLCKDAKQDEELVTTCFRGSPSPPPASEFWG